MARIVLALGSNLGDRLSHLRAATRELETMVKVAAKSPVYETKPMYVESQPAFYNAVLSGDTELGPVALLRFCKSVEQKVGRAPSDRYGPREIDVDIVAIGGMRYRFATDGVDRLVVPHPKTLERRFVLQPLFNIEPDLILPGLGPVADLLGRTEAQANDVRVVENAAF